MLADLLQNSSPLQIVATFVALALIAASLLCLVYIIVGGITFILSAGNEEKIKKAVHTIRFSIIGLFVSFIAFFVVAFLAKLLQIPFDLSFTLIIDIMRQLLTSFQ